MDFGMSSKFQENLQNKREEVWWNWTEGLPARETRASVWSDGVWNGTKHPHSSSD